MMHTFLTALVKEIKRSMNPLFTSQKNIHPRSGELIFVLTDDTSLRIRMTKKDSHNRYFAQTRFFNISILLSNNHARPHVLSHTDSIFANRFVHFVTQLECLVDQEQVDQYFPFIKNDGATTHSSRGHDQPPLYFHIGSMIKSSVATIMARIAALPKDSDTFIFGGGGEPTRYPQLSVIVRYVKERGFRKISLLTHALKLGNASYCEELFSAGVNSIHMIVPAVTSAISRKINAQPIWEKQKQALDTLWHMRTRTFLTFLCELSRQNQDQLIKIITTYKKYNPDEIIIVYTLDPTSLAQFGTLPTLQTIEDMITDQPTTIMVLRHFPFCMIDNKYWRYIQITNRTVKPPRAASCSRCRYEHQCEFPAYHYNQRYPIDLKPIINKR